MAGWSVLGRSQLPERSLPVPGRSPAVPTAITTEVVPHRAVLPCAVSSRAVGSGAVVPPSRPPRSWCSSRRALPATGRGAWHRRAARPVMGWMLALVVVVLVH